MDGERTEILYTHLKHFFMEEGQAYKAYEANKTYKPHTFQRLMKFTRLTKPLPKVT